MVINNYLDIILDRTHYTISLNKGSVDSIKMFVNFNGIDRKYKTKICIIFSWRAEIIKRFLDKLILKYQEDVDGKIYQINLNDEYSLTATYVNKTQWNHEYKLTDEIAMKILFAMKLVSSMERRPRIDEALEVIYSLTDEEISFWSWKVLSLKNRALKGFKAMYF